MPPSVITFLQLTILNQTTFKEINNLAFNKKINVF